MPIDMVQPSFFLGFCIKFLVEKCGAYRKPISDGIVFVFHFAGCVKGYKGSSDSGLT